jgi:hypothetical protein
VVYAAKFAQDFCASTTQQILFKREFREWWWGDACVVACIIFVFYVILENLRL